MSPLIPVTRQKLISRTFTCCTSTRPAGAPSDVILSLLLVSHISWQQTIYLDVCLPPLLEVNRLIGQDRKWPTFKHFMAIVIGRLIRLQCRNSDGCVCREVLYQDYGNEPAWKPNSCCLRQFYLMNNITTRLERSQFLNILFCCFCHKLNHETLKRQNWMWLDCYCYYFLSFLKCCMTWVKVCLIFRVKLLLYLYVIYAI